MKKLCVAVGDRFGRLTTIERLPPKKWRCQCDCGQVRDVFTNNLRRGFTKSCGCLFIEWSKAPRTHGFCVDRQAIPTEYGIWQGIKSRCRLKTNHAYARYGGRGIDVCDEWFDSYLEFLRDMGPRPSLKHSVDRIDNHKGYSKENCRWATRKEQGRNKCNNRILTHNGKTQPLSVWVEETGLTDGTIDSRIRRGWTVDEALTVKSNLVGASRSVDIE